MKDTDIIAAIAPDAVSLMDKAIAEIKRLRQENATLTAEHDALRAERDEARRMYCHAIWLQGGLPPLNVAQNKGWDCFERKST